MANQPLDFTIQLSDSTGQTIFFPLSKFSPLQRTIEVVINKVDFIGGDKESEKVFQTFYFPLEDLQKDHPDFDFNQLKRLEFIFNKSPKGVITLDNLGWMKGL